MVITMEQSIDGFIPMICMISVDDVCIFYNDDYDQDELLSPKSGRYFSQQCGTQSCDNSY
jgi:hypothetical protein